jgi:uncharacterized phage protein (TIGR02220 family)
MASGRLLQKRISNSKKMAQLSCDGARLLYTWMLAHLDKNGNFYADPVMVSNIVFTRLGKSVKDIQKYILEMESLGLILIYEVDGEEYLNYPDFFEKQPNMRFDREGKTDLPNISAENIRSKSGVNPLEVNRIEVNIREENVTSEIITYLNEKAGTEFKVKTKGTIRHIGARLNEGFTLEDMKLVVEHKVLKWKDDPKMSEFLRPETLFGTKFEGYLNTARRELKSTGDVPNPRNQPRYMTAEELLSD